MASATEVGKAPVPVPVRFAAAPPWSRRVIEWCFLALVLVVLIVLFGQHVRQVQARGELAAFKTTLGALRAALVIDHLQRSTSSDPKFVASLQRNPFELLQRRPVNFAGEVRQQDFLAIAPGSWVFDPVCVCAGYLPIYPQWFDSPSGDPMVWFRISAPPPPFQLMPKESYVWFEDAIR